MSTSGEPATKRSTSTAAVESSGPSLHVAPSPHVASTARTTRRMMLDVLVALLPVVVVGTVVFGWSLVAELSICVCSSIVFEAAFTRLRGRPATLADGSAVVTGVILGLSLPWSAPWYVGVVGSMAAIGLGKAAFGGLGHNIFNPAMVGRAFVMISFAAALGASAYVDPQAGLDALTHATPLSIAKEAAKGGAEAARALPSLWELFLGTTNGSLGETSALACLLGGLYLCVRRVASWEIPLGMVAALAVLAGTGNLLRPEAEFTALHHLLGGSLLFGAFFIATDPVSSPVTARGRLIFGLGTGALVYTIRVFSGYPEGVMFAVLVMNSVTPLINTWTIPRPVGGPVGAIP